MMRIPFPGRHHEDVVGGPFQQLVIDLGGAQAFDADEDRAVGRPVWLALEPLRQEHQARPHGGQNRTAGKSSTSSHSIGFFDGLPWSCGAQLAVITKSPGDMKAFSPSTDV